MIKLPTLILLTLVVGFLITGCKKEHTITYGPVTPIEQTELIKVNYVETVKGTDRDGDYFTDIFHLENRKGLKFVKAGYQATPNVGVEENIVYEDTVDGPRISITRRKKNASYELEIIWSQPEGNTYTFRHKYVAVND